MTVNVPSKVGSVTLAMTTSAPVESPCALVVVIVAIEFCTPVLRNGSRPCSGLWPSVVEKFAVGARSEKATASAACQL